MRLIDYITKQHSNLYNHTLHEYGYNSDEEYTEGCEICHAINFQLGDEEVIAIEKETNPEIELEFKEELEWIEENKDNENVIKLMGSIN